jgi:AcrR family transcriptional regulator
MHSVSQSAIAKKLSTRRRINIAAQELAIERGYDGFTLDELAEAVGVSRRTLFNHVAGKEEAVLGVRPEFNEEVVDRFRAGGPTGDLVDDLLVVIVDVLDRDDPDRADAQRFHRVFERNPELVHRALKELEGICGEAVAMASDRPGETDPQRTRVVVTLLVALVAHSMNEFVLAEDDTTVVEHLRAAVSTARALLT